MLGLLRGVLLFLGVAETSKPDSPARRTRLNIRLVNRV